MLFLVYVTSGYFALYHSGRSALSARGVACRHRRQRPQAAVKQAAGAAAASHTEFGGPIAGALPLGWEVDLNSEATALLDSGRTDVWDVLTRRFESRLILAALAATKGRRIEAANKLGIGRNTITRKIQELDLE